VDRASFRGSHGIDADAFVLVLCSRAIAEKGWQIAIDVTVHAAMDHGRNVHLVLIGDGPDADAIISANTDVPCISFLGSVDTPARLLGCFDLGIFPSTFRGEVFPLFVLECFQAGLPVVSTDIGEMPAIMGNDPGQQPGILVPTGRGAKGVEHDMEAAVLQILDDPAFYRQLCANARARSSDFSMDGVADFYEGIFRKVAGSTQFRSALEH
jgi:glycosyltransferase involved in cell wall biosynthesis